MSKDKTIIFTLKEGDTNWRKNLAVIRVALSNLRKNAKVCKDDGADAALHDCDSLLDDFVIPLFYDENGDEKR